MRKIVDFRLLILATICGFLGGALSSIALPQLAFAQDEYPEKIVAHEFHVIDDQGKVVGFFGAGASLPEIILRDENGNIQEQPQPGEGKIMLFDADGLAWYAPPPPKPLVHPLTSGR